VNASRARRCKPLRLDVPAYSRQCTQHSPYVIFFQLFSIQFELRYIAYEPNLIATFHLFGSFFFLSVCYYARLGIKDKNNLECQGLTSNRDQPNTVASLLRRTNKCASNMFCGVIVVVHLLVVSGNPSRKKKFAVSTCCFQHAGYSYQVPNLLWKIFNAHNRKLF
jgi:hypothetical protein